MIKKRMKEKGGIVRKVKGREKTERDITNKMKLPNYFFLAQLLQQIQSLRQNSIGEFRKNCYISYTEINPSITQHRNSKQQPMDLHRN